MAKKKIKQAPLSSTPTDLFPSLSQEGKYTTVEPKFVIKPEGIWYLVVTEFVVHRLNFKMKFGYSFRECTDGTYIAHDDNNEPLFFRLNDESIIPYLPYLQLQ